MTRSGFEIRERPVPVPGPGQVLVRTLGCGICEGDVFHYRTRGTGETVMGHEGSGAIEALGPGVTDIAEGEMVTVLGGAMAELFVAPANRLARVPNQVDPLFALGEPIACCVHAGNRFGIRLGDRAAVVGCGFMGLVCLQLARLQGAAHVCALEPIPWRREMALRLGADAAMAPNDRGAMAELGEVDVVIEATGVQGGIDLVGDLVKQHGRVVLLGYHQTQDGLRSVNMKQWNFKSIDLVMGHVRRNEEKLDAMRAGLDLVATGRLDITPLVTAYPLHQVQRAFDDLVQRKEGLFKAVLKM